jgi:hypothetical protein
MVSRLKTLVTEIEKTLERDGSLDAQARNELLSQIEDLKREIDDAEAADAQQLLIKGLNLLATLLSLVTNVTTLLK